MTQTQPLLDAALTYAAHGWAVLPLKPLGKTPLTARGFKDATTDAGQIRSWWTENPDANIGVATGAVSQISVLDADQKPWKNKHGLDTLHALTEQYGTLPRTPLQKTWSGGWQLVFAYTPEAAQGVNCYGPDLDGRNDGGYVVVPPSRVTEDTREGTYHWLSDPRETPLASMPSWLLDRLGQKGAARKPRTAAVEGLRKGEARNVNLASMAGTLRRRGMEEHEILAMLETANRVTEANLPQDEVEKIAHSIGTNYEPGAVSSEPGGERFTDMMNAGRLAERVRNRAGHVAEMKDKWYVYRNGRLVLEPGASMVPFVREMARSLFEDAERTATSAAVLAATLPDADGLDARELKKKVDSDHGHDPKLVELMHLMLRVKEVRDAATHLESRTGCYNTIEMAKAEPGCQLTLDQLDAHPTWLNTPSSTLDLDTGQLHQHRFGDYLTKLTGVAYDPEAHCPRWEAFLEEVLPDPEVRAFLQRAVGYALTDLTREQCLFFFHGKGRNGKTTFINTLRTILGDYAASTQASTLMVKAHGDDKRNDIAVLRGARLVSIIEAEEGQQIAEALIKQLTGEDPVTARLMYAEFFTFTPTFKIFLAANHKPQVRGTDLAIWRRIHLVPFTETIPLDKVDPDLKARLAEEGPGILNWAVAGYQDYRRNGLQPPKAVTDATALYREEMDPLGEFLAEWCLVDEGAQCPAAALYAAYTRWAQGHGVRFPLTQTRLGMQLRDRGFEDVRVGHRQVRTWRGLQLLPR